MTTERQPYIVGAVKIAPEQRDVAHAVLTPEDDRGWFNIIGGEDDPAAGHTVSLGEKVTYRVDLTDEEAERFRRASNCRYVELDTYAYDSAGATAMPRAASLQFMRATGALTTQYHGRDVLIGLLDGGTTSAVRSYLDATMVAKKTFGPDAPGSDEITSTHGCLVAPCLIPVGGKFLDAIVSSNAGVRPTSGSAAAAVWCADQGAKVINYSGAAAGDNSAWPDMLDYLRDRNIQFYASAGNDGVNQLYFPAAYSTTYANCHSSISFDEATGKRSTFSCYDNTGSGCAPGTAVLGLTPAGEPTSWNGTSASAPHMARLNIMGATGGKFTVQQVGAALKANTRDTGQPDEQQGAGAYDFTAAMSALGVAVTTGPVTSTPGTTTTGGPFRKTNRGPRLVMLTRAGVGPNGDRADGTGLSITGVGGGTAPGTAPKLQAAQAILDRLKSGQQIFEDWTWSGSPAVVGQYNDELLNLYQQETSSTDVFGTAAQTWLQNYINSGGITGVGTGGGGGTGTSVASLLKIGKATGWGKFDIGVGFGPGDDLGPNADGSGKTSAAVHRNYGLSIIERPLNIPGYFELVSGGTRARLSAHLDGGKTSANTQYPRTEFRAYDIDGTTKMACNPNEGTRYIIHKFAVTRMPPDKPELVVAQWHDAEDDTAMVRFRNKTTVEAKLGDTVLGNLTTSYSLGTVATAMIKIIGDGSKCRLEYYWDNMSTPKFTTSSATRSSGWYEKAGCYAQSNISIDAVEDGPFIVESIGLGHWHSKTPKSSSPWPEPVGLKP